MKALQLSQVGRPLALVELPDPRPGFGEIVVAVAAAGICHSDAHYRNGTSTLRSLPLVLGHEIAGVVETVGEGVASPRVGDRVCIHYLWSCGRCRYCNLGQEQFCVEGQMIGKDRDGGYGDRVLVPARNAFLVPEGLPLAHAAVMMCSSATALHALKKARLQPGESVAVFGLGGLGMSAVQIAQNFAPRLVIAVDLDDAKLELAESFGARPVNAGRIDPVAEIRRLTGGKGADVAVELIGLPLTMRQAVASLGVMGRASLAGISNRPFEVASYTELIGKEASVVGVSDHLASEIPLLIEMAASGRLKLDHIVSQTVALEADAVNSVLDRLERFSSPVRTVIELSGAAPAL